MKWLSILGVLVLVALVACAQGARKSSEVTGHVTATPITIGVSLPFSGPGASYGAAGRAAIETYIEELNARGGIEGKPVKIIYEDDACSSESVQAFRRLVNIEHVAAIVGPACSAAAGPALPIAQAASTPTVILASAPQLTKIGPYIFRIYPSDSFVGTFLAKELISDGFQKAAVVYTDNDWGLGVKESFTKSYEKLGGRILLSAGVAEDEKDLRSIVEKIKQSGAEIIVAPTYTKNLLTLLKQTKELGLDLPIIAGDAGVAAEVAQSGMTDGLYIVTAAHNYPDSLKAKVREKLGNDGNFAAPYLYDAIKVVTDAMRLAGTQPEALRDAIADNVWHGAANKKIVFDKNGDLESAQYDLQAYHGSQLTSVERIHEEQATNDNETTRRKAVA